MKGRRIGYAVWLLLTACLYFFENNTGTRAVLLGSLLFPLIPALRVSFFSADGTKTGEKTETLTEETFIRREADEPGDIRPYMPGDPVRRIHWKLSAKKDELLVRELLTEQETEKTERNTAISENGRGKRLRKASAALCTAGILVCIGLLLLVPEANLGIKALCNRLFAASEAVNTYVYAYFPVSENQSVFLAAFILLCIGVLLFAMTALLRSRLMALGITAVYILAQAYFGLAFPAWVNITVCGLLALWMIRRPVNRKDLIILCGYILLAATTVAFALPGVDAATEKKSEDVRDHLSRLARQVTGLDQEIHDGETETRHVHTRSLENGEREAQREREFRLVTVEEEQISVPRWINWTRMILLFLLSAALLILPFAPFFLLNARRKKAQEIRKTFSSANVSEAVQAIFQQVIIWLEITDHGEGNLLYRDWKDRLADSFPEDYSDRFAQCAADFEEAGYSDHAISEEKRQDALNLLKETEKVLWKDADIKQRFLLKYWMCLCE